jgi:hypothetical protein
VKIKKKKLFLLIFVIIVVTVTTVLFLSRKVEAPKTEVGAQAIGETKGVQDVQTKMSSSDIAIYSPISGDTISSGVVMLSGQARGSWYFEASAPVEIQDSKKNVLETGHITAQGDWTTTDFVPFSGEIILTIPDGVTSGFIVFKNDNPSGDPSKSKEVSVPVKFEQ